MFSTPNKAEQSHQNGSFPIVTNSDHGKRSVVLNSASEINIDNGDDDDDEDPMVYYHDCSVAYQSPQHSPSKIPAVVPPVIYSPKLDKGWIKNSSHVMLINKARRFVDEEYTRGSSMSKSTETECLEYDKKSKILKKKINTEPNRKGTIIPNRAKEHHAIAEYMYLLQMVVEIPGRQYCKKHMWKTLSNITTELDDKSQDEINEMLIEQLAMTEEEKLLNEMTDEIFEEQGRDNEHCVHLSVDGSNHFEGDDEEDEGSISSMDNTQGIRQDTTDENEVEVSIGNSKKQKVRRAKVNHLAFVDILEHGKELLLKKDLPRVRTRKKTRLEEELQLREAVFESVYSGSEDSMPEFVQEAFHRLDMF